MFNVYIVHAFLLLLSIILSSILSYFLAQFDKGMPEGGEAVQTVDHAVALLMQQQVVEVGVEIIHVVVMTALNVEIDLTITITTMMIATMMKCRL